MHDAELLGLAIDYSKKKAALNLIVCVGDPDSDDETVREACRPGTLFVEGLRLFSIEKPERFEGHPGREGLWIDAELGYPGADSSVGAVDTASEGVASGVRFWIYVNDWNSFMTVECDRVEFVWSETPGKVQLRRRPTTKTLPTVEGVQAICPSCGQRSTGRFCSACGEEKSRTGNYSLLGHLGEALKVVTNFESNIFRSFAALIIKPGFLTSEYFAGRRKPYLKPLQLFLFCNIAFFLVQSYTEFRTLSTPLSVHTRLLPYSAYARAKVDKAVLEKRTTLREYEARFDAIIENHAKTLVFLMIPMFALLMQALYWRAGRYFVEHLVFATHFYSFYLLLLSSMILLSTAAFSLARRITNNLAAFQSDLLYTTIMLLSCLIYLLPALRRVYGQGWIVTVIKCVILTASIMLILQVYRFFLFFTAFSSA